MHEAGHWAQWRSHPFPFCLLFSLRRQSDQLECVILSLAETSLLPPSVACINCGRRCSTCQYRPLRMCTKGSHHPDRYLGEKKRKAWAMVRKRTEPSVPAQTGRRSMQPYSAPGLSHLLGLPQSTPPINTKIPQRACHHIGAHCP